MDWDVGNIAALVSIAAVAVTVLIWLIRRWYQGWKDFVVDSVRAQLEEKVLPHLTNDETSVAHYAHDARDAAQKSGEASLRAERASLSAEGAAMRSALAAERIELVVQRIDQRLKEMRADEE